MPNFGILENNRVVNVIVADNLAAAQAITDKVVVYADEIGIDWIWREDVGRFQPPAPHFTCVWNEKKWVWSSPKPVAEEPVVDLGPEPIPDLIPATEE